jgi:hypothetical protein
MIMVGALLWAATAAAGPTDAQKCEAEKLKRTGKYAFCRMKADATAVTTGQPADYAQCDQKIVDKFGAAETRYGAACPTSGDVGDIQSRGTVNTGFLALQLSGVRFIDNGDGTVSDVQTGLMWEQKTNLDATQDYSNPNDADNTYTWTASGSAADGTAFTDYLSRLNNCESTDDAVVITGGFANHCDWRLPTIVELKTILDYSPPCGFSGFSNPCISSIFGPTLPNHHWSSTTATGISNGALNVDFATGIVYGDGKILAYTVRAVRGGS